MQPVLPPGNKRNQPDSPLPICKNSGIFIAPYIIEQLVIIVRSVEETGMDSAAGPAEEEFSREGSKET